MSRFALAIVLFIPISVFAQTSVTSDPLAISLAQKAVVAINASDVQNITIAGNVAWIFGSDYETGTVLLRGNILGQSRIDFFLSGGTRSDVRTIISGVASGAWQTSSGTVNSYSSANCWSDAAWFFPGISSLAQTTNPNWVFKYIGLELHGGTNVQHIQTFQPSKVALLQHLSTIDFYLDPVSYLPFAVSSPAHPDLDAGADIPSEIRFAGYQSINGVEVPFRIQRILNGGVVIDITVTSVAFNTGIPSTTFTLQ